MELWIVNMAEKVRLWRFPGQNGVCGEGNDLKWWFTWIDLTCADDHLGLGYFGE
jgi:hypothetical protein